MYIMKPRIQTVSPASLKVAAIVSSVLVLPFMIMELVNRRDLQSFPIPLFGLMWVLPLSFILILMPIVRVLQPGTGHQPNPLTVAPRVVLLGVIAWLWISLVLDQMPCFLGIPNCD